LIQLEKRGAVLFWSGSSSSTCRAAVEVARGRPLPFIAMHERSRYRGVVQVGLAGRLVLDVSVIGLLPSSGVNYDPHPSWCSARECTAELLIQYGETDSPSTDQ
jgi:hypothetical protein